MMAATHATGGVRISAVVPVHDKADTLPLTLDWLERLATSGAVHETVLVMDHCTDASAEIAAGRAARGAWLRVLRRDGGGGSAAAARNAGARASSGTHLLFLDADVVGRDDFGERMRERVARVPDGVALAPVLGNAGSLQTWPFRAGDPDALGRLPAREWVDWALGEPDLADLRTELAEPESGSLDHLPAPWTLGWSSAMAVPAAAFRAQGGFRESFAFKGSEDLDLSYRLWRAGAPFGLVPGAPVLHLPHPRDRRREEALDRLQEREMLALHPTPEMEALCAFDGANANPMLGLLSRVDRRAVEGLARPMPPDARRALALPGHVPLLVGHCGPSLLGELAPERVVCPGLEPAPGRLPLFGFSLPFADAAFPSAVVAGTWQLLPERLAARIVGEALRVAGTVYLLRDLRVRADPAAWPRERLAALDAPYWERTSPPPRSWFDFTAEPLGRAGDVLSFRVRREPGSGAPQLHPSSTRKAS